MSSMEEAYEDDFENEYDEDFEVTRFWLEGIPLLGTLNRLLNRCCRAHMLHPPHLNTE